MYVKIDIKKNQKKKIITKKNYILDPNILLINFVKNKL